MEGRQLFEGPCKGGPLDGQTAQSRFPGGILLVDKEKAQAWLYDWDGNSFNVRQEEPMEALTQGPKNRYRAAEESEYDVMAAPWVGGEPDGN